MKQLKKMWLTIGSVTLFLGGKLKWLLGVFKFLKLGSLLSLLISIGAYAIVYGWKFAVALVYLLFVHEMGHLFAAKKKGIPTTNAIFIPFLGALIALKKEPESANDEAYLAYAGPLWGTLAFLPAFPLYWLTKEPFWGLVIALGALINLFNLMPIHPLDGGRIVGVISPKIWFLGLIGGWVYFFWRPSGVLGWILVLGTIKCWELLRKEFRYKKHKIEQDIAEQFLEQLKRYVTLVDEEKQTMRSEWKEEYERLSAFKKRWYMPIWQDEKKLRQHRTLVYKEHLEILKQNRLFVDKESLEWLPSFITDEEIQEMINELSEIVQKMQDEMQKEKVYYLSDTKTKWLWLVLYIGLAAVLAAFSVYGQELLAKYQHMIS
ncbi:site-2 protease family protein [Anoxybacteroides tepidamans]|uniref:site-2 protease family protein n=1 Tax=Anoxybacteroides tepidamans TaxID=265948 RepID=UPI0004881E8E|nr:site-2 protease family protein [Anoxybacillus tepidamans]